MRRFIALIACLLGAVTPAGVIGTGVAGGTVTASAATSHPLPSHDPFYRYTGHKPLRDYHPGAVLKTRSVRVSLGNNPAVLPALQILYRTTNERHHASATVTTVLTPSTQAAVPRLVAYLSFYDALGSECDPSYTLTGGYAGTSGNEQQAEEEEAILSAYLSDGDTVTVPDFEGTALHWSAGQESGYGTLDGIRATENALHLAARTTPVAMTGYSGGSIAGEWASELAPHYAPSLDLVGVAEGGIPVDYAHNLHYINGSKVWSGVIPAVLVADGRAFGVHLKKYLSAKGRRITHQVRNECIGSFNGSYPGLTVQSLLKPKYHDLLHQPVFIRIVNHLIMGTTKGHPRGPLYMVVGNADGTGDGVMVAKDDEALAHEYCKQGVHVDFTVEKGDTHTQAAVPFEKGALNYVQDWLSGQSTPDNCASIGRGNSLRPVPKPHH